MLAELPPFAHITAKSTAQAVDFLVRYGGKARVLAGGTDLLGMLKDRIAGPKLGMPELLIDIKGIPGVRQIRLEQGGLRIGAAVTLHELMKNETVLQNYSLLAQAAQQVGSTQIRIMGTIGGNICQRPRCLYFRQAFFVCRKKGGSRCYAASGEHRDHSAIFHAGKCIMAHPSDIAPALIALRAKVLIAGPAGERELSTSELFGGPDEIAETILQPNEFIFAFGLPYPNRKTVQLFLKHRIRKTGDFAIASVAVAAEKAEGICTDSSISLGGVAPFPLTARTAEEMINGKELTEEIINEAADAALAGARPLPLNEYKIPLTKTLIKRALGYALEAA